MAKALALGLPPRLDKLADALETANRKDKGGERLMHQTSKPRKPHKDEHPDALYWFDDQDRLDRLYEYCRQDVEVEREIDGRLPALSPAEQTLWQLSCTINNRGFRVDRAFAEAARKIARAAAPEINTELAELTGGDVTGINQVAKLLKWLRQNGCTLEKLNRGAVERQLARAEELPASVQRVLELRLGGAQAAVKKLDALLNRAGEDDRIWAHTTQFGFCAASINSGGTGSPGTHNRTGWSSMAKAAQRISVRISAAYRCAPTRRRSSTPRVSKSLCSVCGWLSRQLAEIASVVRSSTIKNSDRR
jgi:hypothetical protein